MNFPDIGGGRGEMTWISQGSKKEPMVRPHVDEAYSRAVSRSVWRLRLIILSKMGKLTTQWSRRRGQAKIQIQIRLQEARS